MVNLYKLLNVLEQGMSLFQLNKWKTEGLWYPIIVAGVCLIIGVIYLKSNDKNAHD